MVDHVAVLSVQALVAWRAESGTTFASDVNGAAKCRFRSAERIAVPVGIIDVSNLTRPRQVFWPESLPTRIDGFVPYTVVGLASESVVSCAAAGSGTTVIVGSMTTGNSRSLALSHTRSGSSVTIDVLPV